ncbi:hypothetical protein KBD34_01715 [Patescibacteria group bacterium]|nr:hypothetical protein [Patescibacteria group bacterium]
MIKVTLMLEQELKALGLSTHEVTVYLALFRRGRCRAGELIQDTSLHRQLVYQALESLIERHLATKTTDKGIFHYRVTDVEHFRDSVRQQEVTAEQVITSLKERQKLTDQEITVYEGEDAIRAFSLKNAANLSKGECLHVLGSGGKRFEEALGPVAMKRYLREIDQRGAGVRTLMYKQQMFSTEMLALMQNMQDTQIRILPYEMTPTANVVFTNTSVAFQIFEYPYTVIEVKNKHLVEAYRNYFQLLWTQNVRIQRGEVALREAFYSMVDALRPGEPYQVLGGNLGYEYERLGEFFDDFHHYRIQKGVVAQILAQRDAAKSIRERNRVQGDPNEAVSQVKAFQTPFLSPMQINLYQDKAVMVIYQPEPLVLYFENQEIYSGFKLYFDEMWNRSVETLFGHQGIIDLCEQVLDKGEDLYLIAATGRIMSTHKEYFPSFTKRRVEKGIHLHMLANENTRGSGIAAIPERTIRYLPPLFEGPLAIWVFGDTVAHVLWGDAETVFVMRNENVAQSYRRYFDGLCRISRE